MTASEFIKKWQGVQLKEKSAYQEHFLDLCKLVEHPSPVETDKEGSSFCFEKGAIKTGGGNGNFLYLALQALKDLEHKAMLDAEVLGMNMGLPLMKTSGLRRKFII